MREGAFRRSRLAMSRRVKPLRRWPTAEVMTRAVLVDDLGPSPFVTTDTAARFLSLSPHSLECYRSGGYGPPYYKFGKSVRYAVSDLEAWIARQRHTSRRQDALG